MTRPTWCIVIAMLVSVTALASAPVPIVGPNSYRRLIGVVVKVEQVAREIGTSDTTSSLEQFAEVTLKVMSAETVELIEEGVDVVVVKELPKPEAKAKDTLEVFYFSASSPVRAGDKLRVQTRTRLAVSYGWTGPAFGASWNKLER